ncbi:MULTISPECIES: esterase/lipase family protein [unclassified Streptomyces]|uniref:esterase/lipase family protein n=1 Tax=unclassified Streptomyces TaxID=2593676 RepID=UPI00324EEA44
MRRLLTAAAATAALTTALLAGPGTITPAHADSAPVPVVLIHGRNADSGVWDRLKAYLVQNGVPQNEIFTWDYDTSLSTNEVLAGELADYVNSIGAAKVNIVAHSLGSLPSRWYIKYGGGSQKVAKWISLAGPNNGTTLGYLCALWDQGCKDMTPNSWVISHLNQDTATPGPTRYTTLWSPDDEQIIPATSTRLSGATNIEVDGLKHNDFLSSTVVFKQIDEILTR